MIRALFFGIGNRDLQAVYELQGENYRRKSIDPHMVKEKYSTLPIISDLKIKEHERNGPQLDEPIGLCFPILDKIMKYIQDNKIKKLDYLFLLSTDRSDILPSLNKIKAAWEEDVDQIDDDYDYLVNGLIKWIDRDYSGKTAEILSDIITRDKALSDVEITHTIILKLGSYGSLDSIISLDPRNKIKQKDLEIADINTLYFFEKEIYLSLKPYYHALENSSIYLATHAGGMSMMLRSLDNVLSNVLGYANYHRIYTSEYLSYKVDTRSESNFLPIMGRMNQCVINMEWDQAQNCLDIITKAYPNHLSPNRCVILNRILSRAKRLWEAEGSWYERFTAHIFRALYTANINDVVVWISCLEQAAKLKLAHDQTGKLWEKIRDNQVVEISANGKTVPCKIELQILRQHVNEDNLKTAFQDYINVFLDPETLGLSSDWEDIRSLRHKMLHEGVPPAFKQKNRDLIFSFLHIDEDRLQETNTYVKERNLNKIIDFEAECLANSFFAPLGRIIGFSAELLQERKLSERFFEALQETNKGG